MPPNSNNYNKNFENEYNKEQKMEEIVRKAIPENAKEKLMEENKLGRFITQIVQRYKNNKSMKFKMPKPLVPQEYSKQLTSNQIIAFQSQVTKQLNQMGGKRSTRRRHHKKRGTRKH